MTTVVDSGFSKEEGPLEGLGQALHGFQRQRSIWAETGGGAEPPGTGQFCFSDRFSLPPILHIILSDPGSSLAYATGRVSVCLVHCS